MAQKKRPKRGRFKALILYIFFPLVVWSLAFVVWLYWSDLTKLFGKDSNKSRQTPKSSDQPASAPVNRPKEKILDEDRKRLEDVLKQRQ